MSDEKKTATEKLTKKLPGLERYLPADESKVSLVNDSGSVLADPELEGKFEAGLDPASLPDYEIIVDFFDTVPPPPKEPFYHSEDGAEKIPVSSEDRLLLVTPDPTFDDCQDRQDDIAIELQPEDRAEKIRHQVLRGEVWRQVRKVLSREELKTLDKLIMEGAGLKPARRLEPPTTEEEIKKQTAAKLFELIAQAKRRKQEHPYDNTLGDKLESFLQIYFTDEQISEDARNCGAPLEVSKRKGALWYMTPEYLIGNCVEWLKERRNRSAPTWKAFVEEHLTGNPNSISKHLFDEYGQRPEYILACAQSRLKNERCP